MSDAAYYQRDFWSKENLKFSQPHFRMDKTARIIRRIAGEPRGRPAGHRLRSGCAEPAAAAQLALLRHRHGHPEAGPYLLESDIMTEPIAFGGRHFDIIVAQGVFEYLPGVQDQKFAEIAAILKPGGTFLVTYWNYAHRNTMVYHAHTNVQPIGDFLASLARHFRVDRSFPASHNWYHGAPSMAFNKALNMHLNVNIPVLSPLLAVEYFALCSPRD